MSAVGFLKTLFEWPKMYIYICLKMFHYTAIFLFFNLHDQWCIYTSNIFLLKTWSNLRGTTRDVYIHLKKFISTTVDVYTCCLNKLLLRELVAELKTMWLLTWDIGYLSMICNIFEYDIRTWPQVMSLRTWLPTKLHMLLDI